MYSTGHLGNKPSQRKGTRGKMKDYIQTGVQEKPEAAAKHRSGRGLPKAQQGRKDETVRSRKQKQNQKTQNPSLLEMKFLGQTRKSSKMSKW